MLALLLSASLLAAAPAPTKQMGTISFPVSGNAACKKSFTEGMLAMHSFMYDDAREQFEAAVKADPGCAMARWGIAMSYSHPLWGEEKLAESRAALAAITNEAKLTGKERAWIESARVLHGDGEYRPRLARWRASLEKMRTSHPDDVEISLLYALSLVATSERLAKTKLLMESAAISMEIAQKHPKHPGAVHYLIHAADTPDHAVLALPAARQYAKIAPAASHALHMPAHIFVHLGMWEDVVTSNEASWAASEKENLKWKAGNPDDRDWHSYSWLLAANLELGRTEKATKLLDELREQLKKTDGPYTRFAYALSTYAFLSHTGRWDEIDARMAPLLTPLAPEAGQAAEAGICAAHAPGGSGDTRPPFGIIAGVLAHQMIAEAAMRRGDVEATLTALQAKRAAVDSMSPWKALLPKETAERTEAMELAFTGLALARSKKTTEANEKAIEAVKKLAAIREVAPNGPAFETPYHVHLGDFLLELGRPKEALAAYDAALERFPGHTRALAGASRAATAAGDLSSAESRERVLKAQWANADPNAKRP